MNLRFRSDTFLSMKNNVKKIFLFLVTIPNVTSFNKKDKLK